MDLDRIADLCAQPVGVAEPVTLPNAVPNPADFFGEPQFQLTLSDEHLLSRAGLFSGYELVSMTDQPDAYTAEGIATYLADGASLALPGLQRQVGPVRDTCRALAKEGWPAVHAVCTQTPDGAQGFRTHWEVSPVVVVQVRGRSVLYVFDPVVRPGDDIAGLWRAQDYGYSFTGADQLSTTDFAFMRVLSSGDAVVIPAGWPYFTVGTDASRQVSLCPLSGRLVAEFPSEDHSFDLSGS